MANRSRLHASKFDRFKYVLKNAFRKPTGRSKKCRRLAIRKRTITRLGRLFAAPIRQGFCAQDIVTQVYREF